MAEVLQVVDPTTVARRVTTEIDGVPYDIWSADAGGGPHYFLFDISQFFGRSP